MSNQAGPTRRAILAATALATVAPSAFADTPSISFLVVGDWGERSDGQAAVADAMGRVAADIGSAFVISTGDNFYSRGVASVDDPQWIATFEDAFTAPSLQTPWYAVLGNHDYHGSVTAEMDYTVRSTRWRMPARYWQQDISVGDDGAALFMLDTLPLTHMPSLRARVPVIGDHNEALAQLAWLERALASSRARWKFVIGHHPILSSGAHGGSPALVEHLRPLLRRYNVAVYFSGHDHDLEYLRDGPLSYVCCGAGSEFRPMRARVLPSLFAYDSGVGFASCRVRGSHMDLAFHDGAGAQLYSSTLALS